MTQNELIAFDFDLENPDEYTDLMKKKLIDFIKLKFPTITKLTLEKLEECIKENIERCLYDHGYKPSNTELIDDICLQWLFEIDKSFDDITEEQYGKIVEEWISQA